MGAIGSGMVLSALNTSNTTQTTFSGYGNLNPPVRQNGKMALWALEKLNLIHHMGFVSIDAGDVIVGDSHGNRFHVAVFSRDGTMISEIECPYVKVSRCFRLKITSEGYVVTLSKF
ncbi:unnamed protein product [Brachionus calyciflorus]|uniref:Uncharacterized protein n=1 Tax=Brachionus calyciflorus TaxID=104777 RepID=A0A814FDG3_9BILA|nr:unnamed protein product [Brachionus calyciflorus]